MQVRCFFHFLPQMPVFFDGDGKSMVKSRWPAMLLAWIDINIDAFDLIDEILGV